MAACLAAPLLGWRPPATGEPARRAPGRFVVQMVPPQNPRLRPFVDRYVRRGLIPSEERIAARLSARYRFEGDVPIVFRECGTLNAYWSPSQRSITMCYELLANIYDGFSRDYPRDSGLRDRALAYTTQFVFFHELGHALISLLELPIAGREEDAADQLAAYMLPGSGTNLLYPARYFVQLESVAGRTAFSDEHALGEQRFYNLACLVYGSDPTRHAALVEQGVLPRQRAARCPAEHAQVERAWTQLLRPHVTVAAEPAAPATGSTPAPAPTYFSGMQVVAVEAAGRRLRLRAPNGAVVWLVYPAEARVEYQGQRHAVENLEPGDVVGVQLERDAQGRASTSVIRLERNVRGGSP